MDTAGTGNSRFGAIKCMLRRMPFVSNVAKLVLGVAACVSLSCVPTLPFLTQEFNRDSVASPPVPDAPLRKITLTVDARKTSLSDPDLLKKCTGERLSSVTPDAGTESPDWMRWGRFAGNQALVTSSSESKGEQVYATSSPEGTTLLLNNSTDAPLNTKVKIRLSAGVYKIERLLISEPGKFRNFTGANLASAGVITKPLDLMAGEVVLLRCTDVSRAARSAFGNAMRHLKTLAASHPDKANRLRRMMKEGEPYLGSLSPSKAARERRTAGINRLALYISQTHALCRNYQARNTVKEEAGANLMASLEQCADALSETSAALLEMTPQIALTQEKETGKANVEISLCNSGGYTARTVKLALDTESLPRGIGVQPGDPVLFNEVKTGQTVRATFALKLRGGEALSPSRCVADITYFVGKSPAHLRPRAW